MAIVGRRTKQVWEEYDIEINFALDLHVGETLAGTSTVAAKEYPAGTAAPTFLLGSPSISGSKLIQWIQGGTDGTEYLVEFKAITSEGRKLQDEWLITVSDTVAEIPT